MAGLGFEETELRLGLPGGNDPGDAATAARKRGFEETIDLKLKLEQPAAAASWATAHVVEEEQEEAGTGDIVVPAAVPLSSPPAATTGGTATTMKRSPSQSSALCQKTLSVTRANIAFEQVQANIAFEQYRMRWCIPPGHLIFPLPPILLGWTIALTL
ncbi:unnamed protein product [Miscanthus lutarioriparius]|uniref:Uncharacterized protein n=1 Tax=Miscanthus lutarioriparius TaxID=422564 RepID=A0A811MWP8_9POAL|nr:unnamed protein product [Miscanthus lutarioriparius]